jgi:hypothetical protein
LSASFTRNKICWDSAKFWHKYRKVLPNKPSIFGWYTSSVSSGCVCKGENTDKPVS